MGYAKTKTDLIGSETGGTITWTNIAGSGTSSSSLTDVSGKVGVTIVFRAKYGGSAPGTRPKLEIFTAPVNSSNVLDTEPYMTVEIDTTTSAEKQISVPLRFIEGVCYLLAKITNGTTNAADFYAAIVASNL